MGKSLYGIFKNIQRTAKMKVSLKIKLILYRFFSTAIGRFMLRLLSFGISVRNLNGKNPKRHPLLVVVTVDTESGYVGRDERRIWQKEDPKAYQGYYYGISNLLKVFQKYKIKATFFLSTNCFSANEKEYRLIKKELGDITKNNHEIGLHLHPDSDLALQEKLGEKFNATSGFFYDYEEKLTIISTAKKLIRENLGKNIEKKLISFRWGNWALDSGGANALNKLGFKIDSSATPGIKGHTNDTMKYDWSKVKRHYPWKLSVKEHQETNHNNSNILEIPIATFDFFGFKLRADPVNSILLNKAFLEYYNKADRSKKAFPFVVLTHSSEATTKDGKATKALNDLEDFIIFAKKFPNVRFVTMKEAYSIIHKNY